MYDDNTDYSTDNDEEHEYSQCAEETIEFYYPDKLTPSHPMFEALMIELQIALIECHRHIMFSADLRRAIKTVNYLRDKQRGHNDQLYWDARLRN